MNNLTFQRPQRPQNGSRLMCLPAELRQKILRLLLRNAQSISTLKAHYNATGTNEKDTWDASQLSSQVLRCCQILYSEGQHVLYQENTISLRFQQRTRKTRRYGILEVLDQYHAVPDDAMYVAWPEMARKGTFAYFGGHYKAAVVMANGENSIEPSTLRLLARFVNLEVIFGVGIDRLIACHMIEALVKTKAVNVRFCGSKQPDPMVPKMLAAAFEQWRCKDITFDGYFQEVSEMTQIVTGSTPVTALFVLARELYESIDALKTSENSLMGDPDDDVDVLLADEEDFESMWQTVYENDSAAFFEHQSRLAKGFVSRNGTSMRAIDKTIKERNEAYQKLYELCEVNNRPKFRPLGSS